MKYKDSCKTGYDGWSLRTSGDNIVVTNGTHSHIYTTEECFELKDYDPKDTDSWMPLLQFPDHIPDDQNYKFYKDKYKKFHKKEKYDKRST